MAFSPEGWSRIEQQWRDRLANYRPGSPEYIAASRALAAAQSQNMPDWLDASNAFNQATNATDRARLPPSPTTTGPGAGGGGVVPPAPPGGSPGPHAPGPSIGATTGTGAMAGLQSAAPPPVSVNVGGPSARSAALGQRTLPVTNPALSALKGMRLF